jgi:GNAT superfamily N-acetyltransferase
MTTLDLPAVEAVAAIVHPGFFERPEVFAERLALYPDGVRLLELDGAACGYVLSHPWQLDAPPALDSLLGALPAAADTYYLHDLALLPAARGTGAATRLVGDLTQHARHRGFQSMSLIAVNGSLGFWQRQGFMPVDAPALAAKLGSYEDAARLMVKPLA